MQPSPLLLAAAEELRRQGGIVDGPVRVEVTGPDRAHIVIEKTLSPSDFLNPACEGPAMGQLPNGEHAPARRGKMFSPIEEAILKVASRDWQTKAQLAQKCGQAVSSWFAAILSNLVDRQWLESGRNGYRLPQEGEGA